MSETSKLLLDTADGEKMTIPTKLEQDKEKPPTTGGAGGGEEAKAADEKALEAEGDPRGPAAEDNQHPFYIMEAPPPYESRPASRASLKEFKAGKISVPSLPKAALPPLPPNRPPSVVWSEASDAYMVESRFRRKRRHLIMACLILLALWLMVATIMGGVMLFKYLNRRPAYHGWCGMNYYQNGRKEHLRQHVDVDADEKYEMFQVPEFGPNKVALFVHDFKKNLTAIVDQQGKKCFIKTLDPSKMQPPESFIDLLEKMRSGHYDPDIQVIRERYRAVLPPIDVSTLNSPMIAQQCEDRLTLRLMKIAEAAEPQLTKSHRRKKRDNLCSVSEFTGNQILIHEILDP